jgi:hypothetical protein
MRWQVEGADKVTGRERTYTIDADTREKAEKIAQEKGVLVADVHEQLAAAGTNGARPMDARPIDVHGPITSPPPPAPRSSSPPVVHAATAPAHYATTPPPPRYDEIVTSSRWLFGMGVLVAIAGWVLIGLSMIVAVCCLVAAARGRALLPPTLGWTSALYLAGIGLFAIYAAAMTRMVASLGMAIRDIARNRFS